MTPIPMRMLQLKVTLQEIKPPIWRRLAVPSSCTLADLHLILQIAFGWLDYHLHSFTIGKVDYGPHDPEGWTETASERITLGKLGLSRKQKFSYEYDFGDSWVHLILVEDTSELNGPPASPTCLAGKRARPPEDCGGPWQYPELLKALANPGHPEHDESLEWVGGSWDPEAFDLDAVNQALTAAFAKRKAWKTVKSQ